VPVIEPRSRLPTGLIVSVLADASPASWKNLVADR
jgi:hypothetical protein